MHEPDEFVERVGETMVIIIVWVLFAGFWLL